MNDVKFEEKDSSFIEEVRISKRSRCSNFTPQEKNVLIHIVEKYEAVVESKKTDKQSILKKEKVWETISEEFNEILAPESSRTAKQLKMCYENLKRRLKKQVLEENKLKQGGVLHLADSQITVSNDSRQDSDVESNSSTDATRCVEEEACVSVPGDKLSRLSTEVFPSLCEAKVLPERGELPEGPGSLTKLRQMLLKKEIALADLDFKMRTKKYELELRVQEAKLEYYRRKTSLLTHMPNGDA